MKTNFFAAILLILISASTFADETSSKMTAKKPDHAMQSGHKKNISDMKEECEHKTDGHYMHEMMGGHGVDMMETGMSMIWALNLSEDQKSKVYKLSDELVHTNWATQGLINDETAKLRDLYEADKRDPTAIGKEYQRIFDLKRQMIEAYLNTQNRISELLTSEQRDEMKRSRHEMHHMHEYE